MYLQKTTHGICAGEGKLSALKVLSLSKESLAQDLSWGCSQVVSKTVSSEGVTEAGRAASKLSPWAAAGDATASDPPRSWWSGGSPQRNVQPLPWVRGPREQGRANDFNTLDSRALTIPSALLVTQTNPEELGKEHTRTRMPGGSFLEGRPKAWLPSPCSEGLIQTRLFKPSMWHRSV